MRRRKAEQGASLDLLLDTVCNTFGSLIFLALLVSVLLSRTSRTPSLDAAGTRAAVSETEIGRLQAKRGRLEAAAEDVRSLLADARASIDLVASGEVLQMIDELQSLQVRTREDESNRIRVLMATAETQASTAAIRAAARGAAKRLDQTAAEVAQAAARLDRAKRMREEMSSAGSGTNAAGLTVQGASIAPRERKTSKSEFGVLLRYGRMYLTHRHLDGVQTVNTEDFLVVPGWTTNEARARPAAGVPLAAAGAAAEIEARIRSYPSRTWYPCLIVHPDSFEEFQVLKNWLINRGYEYRLLPTASGVTDAGSYEARVQ